MRLASVGGHIPKRALGAGGALPGRYYCRRLYFMFEGMIQGGDRMTDDDELSHDLSPDIFDALALDPEPSPCLIIRKSMPEPDPMTVAERRAEAKVNKAARMRALIAEGLTVRAGPNGLTVKAER